MITGISPTARNTQAYLSKEDIDSECDWAEVLSEGSHTVLFLSFSFS